MSKRNLIQWLAWREANVSRDVRPGLDRISEAWRVINQAVAQDGNELLLGTVISVAGTNGKGTTVHYLERLYSAAGYQVGAYFSPELCQYQERVRWHGDDLDDASWEAAFPYVAAQVECFELTLFEFDTLVALTAIAQQQPDITLLEVGMGGRLDAVNIIDADAAILTSIGLDHIEYLGDTREAIAQEKMGIGRTHKPLFCADSSPPMIIQDVAADKAIALFSVVELTHSQRIMPLPEIFTCPATLTSHAAAAVYAVVAYFQAQYPVSDAQFSQGLAEPGLPGRLQCLPATAEQPWLIFDVAHNPDSGTRLCEFLMQTLPAHGIRRVHWVVGMLADKPVAETMAVLQALDRNVAAEQNWYCCGLPDDPRGASTDFWQQYVAEQQAIKPRGAPATVWDNPMAGYNAALEQVRDNKRECIVITGSFRTVAEIWCPIKRQASTSH